MSVRAELNTSSYHLCVSQLWSVVELRYEYMYFSWLDELGKQPRRRNFLSISIMFHLITLVFMVFRLRTLNLTKLMLKLTKKE